MIWASPCFQLERHDVDRERECVCVGSSRGFSLGQKIGSPGSKELDHDLVNFTPISLPRQQGLSLLFTADPLPGAGI